MRRGAPGSLVIAGGGGGGMLPKISSKLRLSTTSSEPAKTHPNKWKDKKQTKKDKKKKKTCKLSMI